MKKIFAILIIMVMALSLCGCSALEAEVTSNTPQVHITVGKVEPGMTVKDVFVEVTIDNQPVASRVKLTGFDWDGYWEMAEDEPVPEPFAVRVDIFYSLPKGCDVDDVNLIVECNSGNYDGTGSVSFDAQGNVEAWSRAFYGKEPLPPETESAEQVQPTEPTETQPQHTHNWIELPDTSVIDCSLDRTRTFQCSCGETKTETIPAPGHDLSWNETPATCTQDGQKTTFCKVCGEAKTEIIPAPGHDLNWNETPATCTQDGQKITFCKICGETKTEIIPAPGHDLNEWNETPATCIREGQKTTSCKICGEVFTVDLPVAGHAWSVWVNETGLVHKRTCSECGEEETANHNIPSGEVTCIDCGADIIN